MHQSTNAHLLSRGHGLSHGYRPEIDGLRAIAVSTVIAHHFWSDLLPGGFLGVDMFFVISGYVITTSLVNSTHGGALNLFLGFYSRRVKRILPALIVCVLVTSFLGALFIPPQSPEYTHSLKAGLYSLFGLSNIYFSREATDYFGVLSTLNLFTHTWSLGVEEQFYFLFPLIFWLSGFAPRRPKGRQFLLAALGLLTLLSLALYGWLNEKMSGGAYYLMSPRFWELSVGCMAAVTSLNLRTMTARSLGLVIWAACGVIGAALLAPVEQQLISTPAIVTGTVILVMTISSGHSLYAFLTQKYVLLIGLMSYSLYLWHWSVLSLSRWTIGIHWWTVPIQLGAMLALAALSYVYIERPLRRSQWSTSKYGTIGIGVVAVGCAAAVILIAKNSLGDLLYTGTPVQMSGKGVETMLENKWHDGQLQWRLNDCIIGSNADVGKEIEFESCKLRGVPAAATRQFLVIGNSFSVAEFEMYSMLSENGLGSVVVAASWGATPVRELTNYTEFSKANDYYWDATVPAFISRLRRGDVIIMIFELAGLVPQQPSRETADRLEVLKTSLNKFSRDMQQKGIRIIFQSQIPFMREALCTPDMAKPQWFNMGDSPSCVYYSKAETLSRIKPLRDVLLEVQETNENFHIFDAFPFLCSGDVCRFYNDGGVFLYRDTFSHISIEAAHLLRPAFLSAVNEALSGAY